MVRIRLWFLTAACVAALWWSAEPGGLAAKAGRLTAAGHGGVGSSTEPSALLLAVAGTFGWLLAGWLLGLCALDIGGIVPGWIGQCSRRLGVRLTPGLLAAVLHRGVHVGVAVGTVGSIGTAALAVPASAATRTADLGLAAGPPRALCTPAAAAIPDLDRAATCVPPPPMNPRSPGERVVVAGDTLWGIAADELTQSSGSRPSNARIAARWPQWWAANRDVLGNDPGRLLPGERLTPPA